MQNRKELPRNHKGEKLYPVCSWEKNQHKLYNALDLINNELSEKGYTDELVSRRDQIYQALDAFDAHVIGYTVYATYADSQLIKDIIGGYDVRKDFAGHWKTY